MPNELWSIWTYDFSAEIVHISISLIKQDKLLSDVNSYLATLQSSVLSLIKMRDTLRKLGDDGAEELS